MNENQNLIMVRIEKDRLVKNLEEQATLVNSEISMVKENMIEFKSNFQKE